MDRARRAVGRPVGVTTRGTTGHNRLRRADRWMVAVYGPLLRSAAAGSIDGTATRGPNSGTAPHGTATRGPNSGTAPHGTAIGGPNSGTATRGPNSGTATGGLNSGTATGGPSSGTATGRPNSGTAAGPPLVVDLGYGASHTTTLELFTRLRAACPNAEVVGIEIDPERVAAAKPYEREGLAFARGGFELPVPRPPLIVRAFNVLRQYGEAEAWRYWELLRSGIHPHGVIVDGTCSEVGHRAVWATLGAEGPRTLTFAARFTGFGRPSDLAERLPKTLIHRNVPGERIHAFLIDWDRAWATCAPFGSYGARQRWIRTAELLARDWPIATAPPLGGPARWRLGELTLPWTAIEPARQL